MGKGKSDSKETNLHRNKRFSERYNLRERQLQPQHPHQAPVKQVPKQKLSLPPQQQQRQHQQQVNPNSGRQRTQQIQAQPHSPPQPPPPPPSPPRSQRRVQTPPHWQQQVQVN